MPTAIQLAGDDLRKIGFSASTTPGGSGPEGTKPLFTRHDRARLDALLASANDTTVTRLAEVMAPLAGLTATIARALVLRAAIARASTINHAATLDTLSNYATRLAGRTETQLLDSATSLDLDSTVNSNTLDPITLSTRRGLIHAIEQTDTRGDNDGLFQRFTASCGPTVVQMMLCEADPLAADAVNRAGLTSIKSDDAPAKFQKKLLEACGGVAIGRREAQLRARVRNAVGRLKRAGSVNKSDAESFLRHVEQFGPKTKAATAVLGKLRTRFDDFPSDAELALLTKHGALPAKDEGITTEQFVNALHQYVTPKTGVRYASTKPTWGFARGQAWRHLDRVAETLREGVNVPFGTQEPAHWMLLTHVKGSKPNRSFLVSDPEGGRTAWVREQDFKKGTFVDKQFDLCEVGERGFIDCFVLPDES